MMVKLKFETEDTKLELTKTVGFLWTDLIN